MHTATGGLLNRYCFFAVSTLVHALVQGLVVCVSFLDLRKAFDSLDHVILSKGSNSKGSMMLSYSGSRTTYLMQ